MNGINYTGEPFEDYCDEAREIYYRQEAFNMWLENVKQWPKIYNFIYEGSCQASGHDPMFCDGYLNAYGRCEVCQSVFQEEIEAAERAAGWDATP